MGRSGTEPNYGTSRQGSLFVGSSRADSSVTPPTSSAEAQPQSSPPIRPTNRPKRIAGIARRLTPVQYDTLADRTARKDHELDPEAPWTLSCGVGHPVVAREVFDRAVSKWAA